MYRLFACVDLFFVVDDIHILQFFVFAQEGAYHEVNQLKSALGLHYENNTVCLDTGCVWGLELTAYHYPSGETISVPATL